MDDATYKRLINAIESNLDDMTMEQLRHDVIHKLDLNIKTTGSGVTKEIVKKRIRLKLKQTRDTHQTTGQFTLTDEQNEALQLVLEGYNVSIQAVPGAGKTTTLKHIMNALQKKGLEVCGVTYSKVLKEEWRLEDGKNASHIHSFHSLARYFYGYDGKVEDSELRGFLQREPLLTRNYHVVLIDEAQDMNPLYKMLLEKIFTSVQLCVVGQAQQEVFNYRSGDLKANKEFLTRPDRLLHDITNPLSSWRHRHFTLSFRLTKKVANFVNCFFDLPPSNRIKGVNPSKSSFIDYHVVNMWHTEKIVREIMHYRNKFSGKIYLVSPNQIKEQGGETPLKKTSNLLSQNGVNMQSTDDEGTCMVHTTCCGVKGQNLIKENDLCIVFGADTFSDWVSLSQQFVAFTRSPNLVVFQDHKRYPWKTNATLKDLEKYGANVFVHDNWQPQEPNMPNPKPIHVTELVDLLIDKSDELLKEASFIQIAKPDALLPLGKKCKIEFNDKERFEPNTEALYGTMIPMHCETHYQCPVLYERIFSPIVIDYETPNLGFQDADLEKCNKKCQRAVRSISRCINLNDTDTLEQKFKISYKKGRYNSHIDKAIAQCLALLEPNCSHRITTKEQYARTFPIEHRDTLLKACPPDTANEWSVNQTMQAAIAADSFDSFQYKLHQISAFDWVNEPTVVTAVDVIRKALPTSGLNWEENLAFVLSTIYQTGRPAPVNSITGRADATSDDENKVFEFKFTQRLTNSHKLQLLFYMYMKRISQPMESATIGLLINARTGEMWQGMLECTPSEAILFLENLLLKLVET